MKNSLVLAAMILALSLLSLTAHPAEPLAFQGVMKDLGRHMQTIAAAIAYEDWEQVAKTAPLIAAHPQPPIAEKARILAFVGTNMGKFKEFDKQTHDGAHEMEHAAKAGDGMQVINQFQHVQLGCLGCHQAFRKPFVAHFYRRQ